MWVRDVSGVELDDFLFGLFRHAEAVFWVHGATQEFGGLSMQSSIQCSKCADSKRREQGKQFSSEPSIGSNTHRRRRCVRKVVEFDQIHVDADESKFIFRRSMSIVMIVGVCLVVLSGMQTEG